MSRQIRLAWNNPNDRHLLIAVLAHVLIVLCLFWAALNEEGRMQLGQRGVQAVAIQHGAALYLNYCSTCHGIGGRGLAGKAPALNNPQLFGHDFFPEINHQLDDFDNETRTLINENNATGTTDARKAEIKVRLDEITKTIADLNTKRTSNVQSAVDKGYNPNGVSYNRLREVHWEGTAQSFILTTLIHGRPNSGSYWPQAMPAYSQEAFAGQILERYELEDLTAYIMNWDKGNNWTIDDLNAVNQFPILAVDPAPLLRQIELIYTSNDVLPEPVGPDVKAIAAEIAKLTGDAKRGDQLYHAKMPAMLTGVPLPCTGCHQQTANSVGPMTNGTYTRVISERLKQPQFAGFTPEEYLIDSIVNPSDYITPGFTDQMVKNFGEQLTNQDLADLIAYLKTQK